MRALDHREPGILGTVLTNGLTLRGAHLRRHPYGARDGKALVERQGTRARHPRDRCHERRRHARWRVHAGWFRCTGERWPCRRPTGCSPAACSRSIARWPNFVRFTGATIEQGMRLMTTNPAAMTGLDAQAGSIRVAIGPTWLPSMRRTAGRLHHWRTAGRRLASSDVQPVALRARSRLRCRLLRFSKIGIWGAAARNPAKNGSRTRRALPTTLPIHATGTSAVRLVLAPQLAPHKKHGIDQVLRRLCQHARRDRVAFFGQLTDGGRQRGKVRRRACHRPG